MLFHMKIVFSNSGVSDNIIEMIISTLASFDRHGTQLTQNVTRTFLERPQRFVDVPMTFL